LRAELAGGGRRLELRSTTTGGWWKEGRTSAGGAHCCGGRQARGARCYSGRRWANLGPHRVGGRRATPPSRTVGKLEPPALLSFLLLCRSTAAPLDGKIRRRCSIFSQFPALPALPSSYGPPQTAVATSCRCNRLRRWLPPRPCHHGRHGQLTVASSFRRSSGDPVYCFSSPATL
jgi:hypothetical protein